MKKQLNVDKALEMDPYNEDAKIAREKIFDF